MDRRRDPEPDSEFHVRLRAEGQPDLRVVVENGDVALAWASDETGEASVDFDAGARQLFIWGRRPAISGCLLAVAVPLSTGAGLGDPGAEGGGGVSCWRCQLASR